MAFNTRPLRRRKRCPGLPLPPPRSVAPLIFNPLSLFGSRPAGSGSDSSVIREQKTPFVHPLESPSFICLKPREIRRAAGRHLPTFPRWDSPGPVFTKYIRQRSRARETPSPPTTGRKGPLSASRAQPTHTATLGGQCISTRRRGIVVSAQLVPRNDVCPAHEPARPSRATPRFPHTARPGRAEPIASRHNGV